ncbi:M13 family metallopeptidase [Horticoccus luteus]|uniref:M13 family metallopeptidase n=1 Tax=Horticoccus luteus TaxID=2862869 RepID=A0A8F9TV59_9BACT|nr:M13 family metallopeptidase [Horticoccus luteus]QYM79844.1 M13 family metallopeptidase [Horticoccus luteus]
MQIPRWAVASAALVCSVAAFAAIDPKNFDPAVKPQDDFYQFANGGWLKNNPVPPAYSRWGAFYEVNETNLAALHTVLEQASRAEHPNAIEKLVGDFYASGMDEAAIDAAGLQPLQPELDRIDAIKTVEDVQAEIAHLHGRAVRVGFFFTSEQDPKDTKMMIAAGGQGGLGLPDRDYYFRDDEKSKTLRMEYTAHVARMLELSGWSPDDAKQGADDVLQLETALAAVSKKRVDLRDPVANYHKMSAAELAKLAPEFDWNRYFTALDIKDVGPIDIGQPEFFTGFSKQIKDTPVAAWKTYLRWHLLHAAAPYLSSALVNENFQFFDKTLSGTQELRERWKRVLGTIDTYTGEALGQLYVKEFFPPESKARMLQLVENLRAALRDRLHTLEWMDDATKARALDKLNAFGVKIGYPDKWIDYSSVKIDRKAYWQNVMNARAFDHHRSIAKIGQPVDRTEWDMTPPTVNAYYNPTMNEIVFPAGILQPPFFDAKADDAVNYGGIGAVIGHEMTHGFDDEGRQFAADGSLTDWWTPESAAKFKERSAAIVKQFNGYVAIDDLHVNGALTQGENIADLGGLKIAYAALQKALGGKEPAKIGGFTAAQRFFLSWATVWHTNIRDQQLRLQVNTDPHSPARFRVNGPVSNLEDFYKAFDVPAGAPMRRPDNERVEIW